MNQHQFIAARRRVIEQDFKQLNPEQRKAVLTTEGPLLLLAGAGSGKTTVLIQRVANLLTYGRGSDTHEIPEGVTDDDVSFLENYAEHPTQEEKQRAISLCAVEPAMPWSVLAITFTNKAAGELKERLGARLGAKAEDIWASTFHSACVRILRRDIDRLGFEKSFTIYDTDDSKRVIKDIVKNLNLDEKSFPPKDVLNVIGKAKDRYENADTFAETYLESGDWRMSRISKVYTEYEKRLRSSNALDFDDIIFHTVTLLKTCSDVLKFYQKKFRYVLVDEYQDTNHLQYLLTTLLSGGLKNICVVGDDDQSIYRFRGANIENILNFEKQYQNARSIRLEQNYRSTQNILDAANAVIQHNEGRKGKTLWTQNGSGDMVIVKTCFNENDEANYVVTEIMRGVQQGRLFKDHAILYRMNAQSNALENAMRRNGISYKIVGGMKFFDRAEIKDMLSYLCVLNNPMDDLRLRRIINTPKRSIGLTTMNKVQTLALEQGSSLYEIIRNADLFPVLKAAAPKLLKFANLIDNLRQQGGTLALPEFYDAMLEQTGYVDALKQKDDVESRGRIENVQELKSNILAFLEQEPEDATLTGFLNEISLYTDLDSMDQTDDCVTMMTMHSAKGLEFPFVYVVGMENGMFPGQRAIDNEEEMEEERRLCYVAMTRAKQKLTLTNARQRMLYGRTSANQPSKFLNEIPEEIMEWLDKPEPYYGGLNDRFAESDYTWESRPSAQNSEQKSQSFVDVRKQEILQNRTCYKTSSSMLQLSTGDEVVHTAFGKGNVISIKPMGGDALLEVQFETAGKKKLMLKTAGKHMKKANK